MLPVPLQFVEDGAGFIPTSSTKKKIIPVRQGTGSTLPLQDEYNYLVFLRCDRINKNECNCLPKDKCFQKETEENVRDTESGSLDDIRNNRTDGFVFSKKF